MSGNYVPQKGQRSNLGQKLTFGKYRGIIVSVALFLLLDASVLLLNFYVSFEIADDAIGVNLAGRQRMLSQRMAKTLFVLDSSREDPLAFKAALDELQLSKKLFDETLQAFINGGTVRGAGKEIVELEPVTNRLGKDSLQNTLALWLSYKNAIDKFTDDATGNMPSDSSLSVAVAMARVHNLPILTSMNDLTISLEQVAASKATRLRIIQTLGISLAIINFLFIMFHFVRQLRDSDKVIEKARQETTEILETVNEGLFLIDKDLVLGEQHSARLVDVLGPQQFAGRSFQSLLENIVSEKDAETARGFIELLFDQKIKEKLIGDLNPLSLVEVNIAQVNGGFLTKHLQFSFARAYQKSDDGILDISHVLVTVLDISAQIKLERELTESRKHNESQLEMLTSLLHTHPGLLKEFIANSFQCYNRINNILRQPAKTTQTVRDKATSIFREIHNFKGEAASLKLEFFENAAHRMEDVLALLREKHDLSGNDYLALTVQLESLISYTQQVEHLTEKLGQFAVVSSAPQRTMGTKHITGSRHTDGWDHLNDFVQNIALRNGKLVKFVASGLNEISLHAEYQQQVKEICIQLLRNAVVHGIESPRDRELSEKPLVGRIDLHLAKLSDVEMELMIMDDGQGLDYAAIRNQARNSGKYSEEEIESWTNKHLLGLIFQSGFSTASEVNKDAGRGVGMEAVMNHVLAHRGKINVSSRMGRHCRFVITLPIVPAHNDEEIAA
jgi:two-component system, chemotaxis family, sensor kinase CheA